MKKTISAVMAIVIFICVALNGCSFEMRSIDSLMRPPHTATESALKNSINKLLGNQISYRSPESGEYHSAITMRDLNGDSVDEAVVFYVKNDDVSVVRMCVLTQSDDEWILVSDFAGNGSGILNLEFADLNSDSDEEIMVSWFLFDDKSQKVLSVYTCGMENEALTVSACISEPYNLMTVADVYGGSDRQLLIAYSSLTKAADKSTLKLISINEDDEVLLINEISLDSRITKLSAMLSDFPDGSITPRFYIDAEISDGQKITQVIKWDTKQSKFIGLLGSSESSDLTLRSSDLPCRDVDEDGIIEIPLRRPLSESINSDTSLGYLLVWCKVKNSSLKPSEYYVVNSLENYTLYFPTTWLNKVYVKSDNAARTWNFVNATDETLFSITAYDFENWDENSSEVTEMLMVQNDTVYCCTVTSEGKNAGVSAVDLIEYFSLNI